MSAAAGARPTRSDERATRSSRGGIRARAGQGAADLGALARFWLQRHQALRELEALLRSGSKAALDARHRPEHPCGPGSGASAAAAGARGASPGRGRSTSRSFAALEPGLAPRLRVLERDHEAPPRR